MNALESKPRGPNIPLVCIATNLPAHPSAKHYNAWHEQFGTSCKVHRVWQCESCGMWHAETSAPDPAGSSSGTGRSSKQDEETVWPTFPPTVRPRRSQFVSDAAWNDFYLRHP